MLLAVDEISAGTTSVEQRWLRRAIAGSALPAQAKASERRSSERRSRFTMKKSDDFGALSEAACLITIEIRSELLLCETRRLTMIEWQNAPSACVFYSPFPTIHMRGSTASSQSLLRRKRFSVVSRITNKCLLESVTVTQLLKQFPISNADGHISGPRPSFSTGLSVCTSTQCALQHIKNSASCVWVTYP